MKKKLGLTRGQLAIVVSLGAVAVVLVGLGVGYVYVVRQPAPPPPIPDLRGTLIAGPAALAATDLPAKTPTPTDSLPSATPLPTYAYLPTFTPMPSPTSFVWRPAEAPASGARQVQSSSGSAGSGACTAALEYAAEMHEYNLDMIDYVHSPMIGYYEYVLELAIRDRDALGVTQAQRLLASENAQVKAEKVSENRRYKAERASIEASCG